MDWVVEWSSGGVAVFGVDLATCNAPHHNFFLRYSMKSGREGAKSSHW